MGVQEGFLRPTMIRVEAEMPKSDKQLPYRSPSVGEALRGDRLEQAHMNISFAQNHEHVAHRCFDSPTIVGRVGSELHLGDEQKKLLLVMN